MVTFVALMKPYVETHPIGLLWVALWVITGVIELAGAARRREEATNKDSGQSLRPPYHRHSRRHRARGLPKDRAAAEIRPPLVPVVDEDHAVQEVERLIRTAGFEPVNLGGIEQSGRLEVGGDLHDLEVGHAEARSLMLEPARFAAPAERTSSVGPHPDGCQRAITSGPQLSVGMAIQPGLDQLPPELGAQRRLAARRLVQPTRRRPPT